MPTVSLCMAVKDEAETLAQAIESVLPAIDEVVIGVDEASSDATLEIARRYASPGKLFTFVWADNFSAARNQVLQRASGDVVLILDGHEHCPPDDDNTAAYLARMRKQDPSSDRIMTPLSFLVQVRDQGIHRDFDVICITLAMNPDEVGVPKLFFLQPRIFRRGEIHYIGSVHNYLGGHGKEQAIGCPEGVLVHQMPAKREARRQKQRKKMNVSGLKRDAAVERAKPKEQRAGRPWFYLGNTYSDMGQPMKALPHYLEYLKWSKFGEERRQALQQVAIIYFRHFGADLSSGTEEEKAQKEQARTEGRAKARKYVLEAMMMGWRHAEPILLLAEIACEEKDWEQVLHWCQQALQVPAPHSVMFLQGPAYAYMPHVKAMQARAELGDWMGAIHECQQALSWRAGDPKLIEQLDRLRQEERKKKNASSDCNMLVVDRIGSFTGDLAQHFGKTRNVVRRQTWDERWEGWADLAWFEWCDQNVVGASRVPWRGPLVCRLHSYEAFGDVPGQVNWPNVDALVFVAEHIRDLVLSKWPHIAKETRVEVIPNGVNPTGLTYRERSHGRRIGCLGYLNSKKGPEVLVELMRRYRRYEWHIGGEFQDAHLAYWFRHAIEDLPHVWYHGWVDAKDEWLESVDYIVSPSIVESFGYSVAEAMLKGIKPLIRDRQGVKDLWPHECVWKSVDELGKVLEGPYESERYRDWVLERYSLDKQLALTDALLGELMARTPARPDYLQGARPVSLEDVKFAMPAERLGTIDGTIDDDVQAVPA